MAAQLEQEIMREIGLGMHYDWRNGSGSCEYIRKDAAKRLPDALQAYHNQGKEVAAPNNDLCNLLYQVARNEEDRYTLTNTWCAASYIIQAHLYLYHAKSKQEQQKIIKDFSESIRNSYLPRHHLDLAKRQGYWGSPSRRWEGDVIVEGWR